MNTTRAGVFFLLWLTVLLRCYGQETAATPARAVPDDEKQIQVNWIYGAFVPKDVPLTPLSNKQRWQLYARQTYTTPGIYLKTLLFSAGDQVSDSPREWDNDWAGFGQRVASRHGQFVIQNSLSAIANGLLRYEPRYDRCRCSNFWPRTAHALVRNFVTYDRSEMHKRPQLGSYAAAFGAGAIASTWKPGEGAWAGSYRSAITQAGFGTLTNMISEFAPEILRVIRKPKPMPPTK
jgi:hypothetical protein